MKKILPYENISHLFNKYHILFQQGFLFFKLTVAIVEARAVITQEILPHFFNEILYVFKNLFSFVVDVNLIIYCCTFMPSVSVFIIFELF